MRFRAQQRCRGVIAVRNQAHPVAAVQLTRLGGDVRFGEAQVQIGWQQAVAVLGHHRAIPACIELVDQDAVEAGEASHMRGGQPAQVFHRRGGLDAGHQLADRRVQLFQRTGLARNRRLQFNQKVGCRPVHEQLVAAMAIQMHRAHVCAAADRGLLQHRLERRQHATQHLGDVLHQWLAELLQQGGVADGALTHLQRVRFHHQKHTVRLDRAGGMDRFARATRQGSVVRGLSRRHQGRDS